VGGTRDAAAGHPSPDRLERVELSTQEPVAAAGGAKALALVRALPRTWQIAVGVSSLILVAACFVRFGLTGRAVVGGVFAAVLVLLSAIDLDCRLIPNVIVLPATAVLLVAQIALYPHQALEWVLASFLAALVLFLPLLVIPTGMGMGDVKLAALLGAVLGQSVAAALLIGVLAGGVFSLALLLRGGMGARKKTFAYGPFLALGGLVVLLLGGR
jgi:leader peptidase (prepilin peptidase)/N-methyltransferase